MKINPAFKLLRFIFCALAGLAAACAHAQRLPVDKIRLPPGFQITVFASNVPNARGMAWGDKGTLFVGSRGAGNVYALKHKDGKATQVYTLATGLNMPSGLAFSLSLIHISEPTRPY